MHADRHVGGRQPGGEPGAGQAADVPEGVEPGEDRAPVGVLDAGGVGVHGHVEQAVAGAEHGERDDEQPQVRCRRDGGQAGAQHRGAHHAGAFAADQRDERRRPDQREHRSGGEPEEPERQLALRETEPLLRGGHAGGPGGEGRPADQEDDRDTDPCAPGSHRPNGR
jgi:hypothetical protein